jgi:hypothetical protein
MEKQNFRNHVRYYPPHHFIFYPIITALFFIGIRGIMEHKIDRWEWIAITVLAFMISWLSFMTRQHYALTCQNRIVRLELRLRYYQLTNQRLEIIEDQLSFKQLAALRFASDEELVGLIKRTLEENLSPADIKRSINNWIADTMRV